MAATTLWRLEVDGETIEEIRDFDYSSDIMAIGEQCRWSLVNPDDKYVGRLLDGSIAKVYAVNADVNGGAPTLKFKGRVIRRVADYSPQGSLLELQICDLGWHLVNCDAPLWFKLDRAIFQDLIDPAKYLVSKRGSKHYFIDPSFGFTGYSTDGLKRRQVKLSSAQALAAQQTAGPEPVFQVQVEPGQKIYGTISEYAQRENRLINVSPTGEIQAFLPDYAQAPLYTFDTSPTAPAEQAIMSARETHDCTTKYTLTEVVGQQLQWENATDATDPNATKKRGTSSNGVLLPFLNRWTGADADKRDTGAARRQAQWAYKRGLYDSFSLEIEVPNHHQGGIWYESDTMANVRIPELGISGLLYVAAVRYKINQEGGDTASLTLRLPGLLTAKDGSIERFRQPPTIRSLRPIPGLFS